MHHASLMLGLGMEDLGLLFLRVVTGGFFFVYRFRWVFDPSAPDRKWLSPTRHVRLTSRLSTCGFGSSPSLSAAVALIEIFAGLGLVFGLLTLPSALGLAVILVFANCCTPKEEIPLMHPVDKVDYVRCYLHLAEPLYLMLVLYIIMVGPGRYSLDTLIWRYFQ